jgi:phytoene dehydrogenase-like protein
MSPGTAYVLMHHSVGDEAGGKVSSWGQPIGGMGAVADACRSAAESFGAEIRVNAGVSKVTVTNGRATGVVLEDGEEITADLVVTTCHPQITFLDQIDRHHLPDDFVHDIEHWRTRSGTVKINLALDRLPEFTANPGFDQDIHGGAIAIMDDLEYLETAFQEARSGKAATLPFSDCEIPTVYDRTLAPEGKHIMSLFTQWVPESWSKERNQDELDAYAQRLYDRFDAVAPGFKDSILHEQVIGPYEMEQDFGLVRGVHLAHPRSGHVVLPRSPGRTRRDAPIGRLGPVLGGREHRSRPGGGRTRPARLAARAPPRPPSHDRQLAAPRRPCLGVTRSTWRTHAVHG